MGVVDALNGKFYVYIVSPIQTLASAARGGPALPSPRLRMLAKSNRKLLLKDSDGGLCFGARASINARTSHGRDDLLEALHLSTSKRRRLVSLHYRRFEAHVHCQA